MKNLFPITFIFTGCPKNKSIKTYPFSPSEAKKCPKRDIFFLKKSMSQILPKISQSYSTAFINTPKSMIFGGHYSP